MEIKTFFEENRKAAIAFSGGVDSAYLMHAALTAGAEVRAYYVKSCFQPQFELDDAMRLARELDADMKVLDADVLSVLEVRRNPADRCYHCKKQIFSAITRAAGEDGFSLILDGTNASDDVSDRPGMAALKELKVRSPLRECGLTKDEIRSLSKEAGLFTWNKPAYACLATRIPAGEEITPAKLERTERAEAYLMSLGFTDFRVRQYSLGVRKSAGQKAENVSEKDTGSCGSTAAGKSEKSTESSERTVAVLQVRKEQLALVMEKREEILAELEKYYDQVTVDLKARDQ